MCARGLDVKLLDAQCPPLDQHFDDLCGAVLADASQRHDQLVQELVRAKLQQLAEVDILLLRVIC